jgi:hypothetical protein
MVPIGLGSMVKIKIFGLILNIRNIVVHERFRHLQIYIYFKKFKIIYYLCQIYIIIVNTKNLQVFVARVRTADPRPLKFKNLRSRHPRQLTCLINIAPI